MGPFWDHLGTILGPCWDHPSWGHQSIASDFVLLVGLPEVLWYVAGRKEFMGHCHMCIYIYIYSWHLATGLSSQESGSRGEIVTFRGRDSILSSGLAPGGFPASHRSRPEEAYWPPTGWGIKCMDALLECSFFFFGLFGVLHLFLLAAL